MRDIGVAAGVEAQPTRDAGDRVLAAAGGVRIEAGPAVEPVMPASAIERVAVPAVSQPVVAVSPAVDDNVAGPPGDDVLACVASDLRATVGECLRRRG